MYTVYLFNKQTYMTKYLTPMHVWCPSLCAIIPVMWLVITPHLSPVTKSKGGWYHHQGSVPAHRTQWQHGLSHPPPVMGLSGRDAHSRWSSTKISLNFYIEILLLLGFNCLSQEKVDLVIAKGKKALGKAKPAMIRLTFHDCVGEFSQKFTKSADILLRDIEKICVHSHSLSQGRGQGSYCDFCLILIST